MRIVKGGYCDECGRDVRERVCIGEEPNYESATAYICKLCLFKALAEFAKYRVARKQFEEENRV